ncbi:MAG: hypothetical protein KatS3mg095_0393 [Candidatus Parcubacteria bacterium]|nr:MAG: hypothetical protein KatS3mg095_0393 [Candidatus Parcubacteria bacterium]
MLQEQQINQIRVVLKKINPKLAVILRALGDKCRCSIFILIIKHKDLCVTDIAKICGITVSAASQHLRILERLGLVVSIKMGKEVCYQVNKKDFFVKQLINFIKKSIN